MKEEVIGPVLILVIVQAIVGSVLYCLLIEYVLGAPLHGSNAAGIVLMVVVFQVINGCGIVWLFVQGYAQYLKAHPKAR
jgi:hypothetical protein